MGNYLRRHNLVQSYLIVDTQKGFGIEGSGVSFGSAGTSFIGVADAGFDDSA